MKEEEGIFVIQLYRFGDNWLSSRSVIFNQSAARIFKTHNT